MIDVGKAQYFACDECPIVEQLDHRLSVAERHPEYGDFQFDYCACDKVDAQFFCGGYCEDAWISTPACHIAGKRRTGRSYRRNMRQKNIEKFLARDNQGHCFGPYIHRRQDKDERVLGTFIRYPKSSANKVFFKRVSNKKVRQSKDIPLKGNKYRKVFDYWWTID